MGKSTISMAIFNSKLLVDRRVFIDLPLVHPLNHFESELWGHFAAMDWIPKFITLPIVGSNPK
jgi:hypothetical protein